jgi:dTDP-4-dehydrorhamnose 3,5-epimerase-like enzyme
LNFVTLADWELFLSLIRIVSFPPLGDDRGSLVALEAHKTVPFDIKRVYYIFGTLSEVSRGFHAHRKLQQVAVCVTGKCRMVLDDGQRRAEVWLDSPTKGLLIGDLVWREMHDFSPDCVLLVLASEHYDETDYIRSYDEFKLALKP